MFSDDVIREAVRALRPIVGRGFRLELVEPEPVLFHSDHVSLTLSLVTYEDEGEIRDVKQQEVHVLSPHQRNERGLSYLRIQFEELASNDRLDRESVETSMPADFFITSLPDVDFDAEAFRRIVRDRRARRILEVRRNDDALIATLDPATRKVITNLSNLELESQLLASPEDRGLFAVYADWLAERGDPRGELIAVQLGLEDDPGSESLRRREVELLEANGYEWLGEFAWSKHHDFGAKWRRGFVHTIRLGAAEEHGWERGETAGFWEWKVLTTIPKSMFLTVIEVGPKHVSTIDDAFHGIAEHGVPPSVKTLVLRTHRDFENVTDLPRAYRQLDGIQELVIECRQIELDDIDLPKLRSLEIVTRGLTRDNLASMRRAHWPRLERLILCIGESGIDGCDIELDDVRWIFDGTNLEHVTELGLAGRDAHAVAKAMVGSRILPCLRTLDLSRGTIGEGGDVFFRQNAAAFAHLERLSLPVPFPDRTTEALQELGPHVTLDQRYIPLYE